MSVLVTSMKDEGPYLLEWLAYHLALGFEKVVVLANDCTDGTDGLLERAAELGLCTYVPNFVPRGKKPHSAALKLASTHPAIRDAEFAMVLDADEFLVVKEPGGVRGLTDKMASNGWDVMLIPWRIFGSSGHMEYHDRPVLERFQRSSDPARREGVKSLFRVDRRLRLGIHFPRPHMKGGRSVIPPGELNWVNANGESIDLSRLSWNNSKGPLGRDYAEVAHYMCKSLDEYLCKIVRGDGLLNSNRHGIDYWRKADADERGDLDPLAFVPGFQHMLEHLLADPELRSLHRAAVEHRSAHIRRMREHANVETLRSILEKSTKGGLTAADVQQARAITNAVSPRVDDPAALNVPVPVHVIEVVVGLQGESGPVFDCMRDFARQHGCFFASAEKMRRKPVSVISEAACRAASHERSDCVILIPASTKGASADLLDLSDKLILHAAAIVHDADEMRLGRRIDAGDSGDARELQDRLDAIAVGECEDPVEAFEEALSAKWAGRLLRIDLGAKNRSSLALREAVAGGDLPECAASVLGAVLDRFGRDYRRGHTDSDSAGRNRRLIDVPFRSGTRRTGEPIRVGWFRRGANGDATNFGDELGPFLVGSVLNRRVKRSDYADCDVVSIGSILGQVSKSAMRAGRARSLLVWGSGLIDGEIGILHPAIRLLAVRGTETLAHLDPFKDVPTGDPGILVSRYVSPLSRKRYRWGIVPHFTHRNSPHLRRLSQDIPAVRLIDPTSDFLQVVQSISACDAIVSSSLHGLIVADSYGIPAVWLQQAGHKGYEFKFEDYRAGVTRAPFATVTSDNLSVLLRSDCEVPACVLDSSKGDALERALRRGFEFPES